MQYTIVKCYRKKKAYHDIYHGRWVKVAVEIKTVCSVPLNKALNHKQARPCKKHNIH